MEALSEQWREALAKDFKPVFEVTQPVTKQARMLAGKGTHGGEMNVGPAISPDGRRLAFYSERDLFSVDVFLADGQSGKVLRKVTQTAIDPHWDSLQFVNSAGAWSFDSRFLALTGVRNGRVEIQIYDAERRQITRRIRVGELSEAYTPAWSPDGERIAFSGVHNGVCDLYVLDLGAERLRRLTNDGYSELHPSWSPDGRWIAVATDRFSSNLAELRFGEFRLALVDPATGAIEQLPGFDRGKHLNPQWSQDGRSLYFVSDRDGIPNLYRLARDESRLYQLTNLQTGVSGISALSPAFSLAAQAGRLVFSVFHEGGYSLFSLESVEQLTGHPPLETVAPLQAGVLAPRERSPGLVAAYLESSREGLAPVEAFQDDRYRPRLSLEYVAPPQLSVGMTGYGSLIGGGLGLYFSDLLGYHNLMLAFQTSNTSEAGNFLNNLSAIASYENHRRRWIWGLVGGQTPYLTGGYGSTYGRIGGEPVVLEESVVSWQIDRQVAGILAYPFNRAQRLEFTAGYRNISFDAKASLAIYSARTGQFLGYQEAKLTTADPIHLATASTALVYDTSVFGGTSPVLGQRYRLEAAMVAGGLNHITLLGDYRRYLRIARPFTLAGRFLHYGRYMGDAEDERLQDLYLGYPSLVRGYGAGSFTVNECGSPVEGKSSCPVFDQLFGSRMLVANVELRAPLFGFLGVVPSKAAPPTEAALFYDAGLAWTRREKANFLGGPRKPVQSCGASVRLNVLGYFIAQVSYVHPLDRPARRWLWEFSILPGF